jgi:hypothetical protein
MAVDTEASDAIGRAELQCIHQGRSVSSTQISQLFPTITAGQPLNCRRRRGTELDWGLVKDAAKAETNHNVWLLAFSQHDLQFWYESLYYINRRVAGNLGGTTQPSIVLPVTAILRHVESAGQAQWT